MSHPSCHRPPDGRAAAHPAGESDHGRRHSDRGPSLREQRLASSGREYHGAAALPTGTLTLPFTDIEASTRPARDPGEQYAPLLAEHQRRLRGAASAHGGTEVTRRATRFQAGLRPREGAHRLVGGVARTLAPASFRRSVRTPTIMDAAVAGTTLSAIPSDRLLHQS